MSCAREQDRHRREKHLQQRVQETLCLSPPNLPTPARHTDAPASKEQAARQYKSKLRINRIRQVRAQDALFAAQRVSKFRDRKASDNKMILNRLRDAWSNEKLRRIADLEEEFAKSCEGIGMSHDAAQLAERRRVAKSECAARQAEESLCWDALRVEEALHKERELRELRESAELAPTLQRQIVEKISNMERSNLHSYDHGPTRKPREKQTYVVSCREQGKMDAWRAADERRENVKHEKENQIELERLLSERRQERGNAAAAKLLNDKRIAVPEEEVEEACRMEELGKDLSQATVNDPGFFQRASTCAGQRSRIVYNKHRISNPLSCPGLPHTSRTCCRCRSCVELISHPPYPATGASTPEFCIECEHDAEPEINISVRSSG